MQRLHDLEAELAAFEQKTMRAVTAEQKRQILQLAKDFPHLWAASTTKPRDRKRILRLLVRDITVQKGPEPKLVRLQVRWQGGETETLQIQMPQNRADVIRYPEAFVARLRELAVDYHDDEIVTLLRKDGQSTGKPIALGTVKWLRYKHRIPAPKPPPGTLNVRQVRDRAASIPVAARPVGRLPPGLVPKEGRAFWFRQHLEWLSIRHRRFTHARLPDTHLTGSHPPFPSTLTTPAVILERLVAVWTLILQSEPEGPALISCAARLLRSDSTFANLLLTPSWRTDFGHLKRDIAAMAHDLRADLDEFLLQACQRPIFDRLGRRQRA